MEILDTEQICARRFIETVREPLVILDSELRIVAASKAFYRLFGISAKDVANVLLYELNDGEFDIPGLRRLLESVVHDQEIIEDIEFDNYFKNGRKILAINARCIVSEQPSNNLVLLAIEDLTESIENRKYSIEDELRRKTAQLKATINSIPDGYIVYGQDRNIVQMNEVAEQILGFTGKEGNRPYEEQINLLQIQTRSGDPFPADMIPSTRAFNGEIIRNEIMKINRADRFYWLSVSASPIVSSDGSMLGVVMDFADITDRVQAEEQVNSDRELLQTIIDTVPAMISIYDPQINVITLNQAFFDTTGWSREDVKKTNVMELVYPEPGYRAMVAGFMQSLAPGFRDLHMVTKNGGIIESSWANVPLPDGRQVGIGINITDRKLLEKQLEDERDFVAAVLQTSGAIITVIDRDGMITRFNKAAEELTGYLADEVIGRSLLDLFILPEERQDVFEIAAKLFAGEGRVDFENHWLTRDGEKRFIRWRNSILRDETGKPVYAIATGIDITDRKRVEQELLESRERFAAAFRSVQDALIISDLPTGLIIDVNQTWTTHWGYSAEESIGRRSTDLGFFVNSQDRDRALEIIRKEGRLKDFEIFLRTRSGELRNAILFVEQLMLPNQSLMLTIIHDITDRRKTEQALLHRTRELATANKELEAFSYSVSHDLRSPLATIYGFSNLLLEEYGKMLDENGLGFLNHIKIATDKMVSIIDDLLKMARISKEKMKISEIDLNAVANSIINELRKSDPERKMEVNIAENIPAKADPGFMNIILTNLIGNAWKYTGKNPDARIDIGLLKFENENVYFVGDNGAGFEMKYAYKLFQPFERLHPESEFKGTGLGLTIVQKIIQRHGGRIWAESEPGKGAVFYFTLSSR